MDLLYFLGLLADRPVLLVVVLLVSLVILINGWTDAPNAIATCVSTRAMSPRAAVIMAVIFNFLGVLIMSLISSSVTATISNMGNFHGDTHQQLIAICAGMVGIVIWATAAWFFGIPTSESHALIAGIAGAAVALNGLDGFSGTGQAWLNVLYGIIISTVIGFGFSFFATKVINYVFRKANRRKANKFFAKAQIVGGASMAFMHGAQDGLKFMGVFLLATSFIEPSVIGADGTFVIPVWLMIYCSIVMGLGTSIGGYKIIKTVGLDMVRLNQCQGFISDITASTCLFFASLVGIPISTTHMKSTSIMGVGSAKRFRSVDWNVVKDMVLTWVLTFPGCGLCGFLIARLFLFIF
ncbi:MAG TPA: inorganic phosphate transporter [Erysipelotrichaceae bacterium]|nr:inorganic phosphate transporter [Erysipelotrichaceae bacterium]